MHKWPMDHMRERIEDMGFGEILKLAAKSLDDRDFISWLMDQYNLENTVIEIGGGKILQSQNMTSIVCLACHLEATIPQ
jgi:hypothetical protein